jgi:murein DD-endopeptidase MepM/ murein hydrolase activator NlpD
MKLNCNSFCDGDFQYLDLNDFYLKNKTFLRDTRNPFLIQFALDSFSSFCYGNITFGGYGEDRKDVWKGTYLDKDKNYIHLGIDINAKQGTPIKCPFDATVVDIFTDVDTQIGWGGRVILQQSKDLPYLVLAHIEPSSFMHLTKGENLIKGEIIGKVGTWPTNGNTFEHLHVQCVKNLNIHDFDGYGYESDLANNPDPFQTEFL